MHKTITHKNQFNNLKHDVDFIYQGLEKVRLQLFMTNKALGNKTLQADLKVLQTLCTKFGTIYQQLIKLPIQWDETGKIIGIIEPAQNNKSAQGINVSEGSVLVHLDKMYKELAVLLARTLYRLLKIRPLLDTSWLDELDFLQQQINTLCDATLLTQLVTMEINQLWLKDFETKIKEEAYDLSQKEQKAWFKEYRVAQELTLGFSENENEEDDKPLENYDDLTQNTTLKKIFNVLHWQSYQLDINASFMQRHFGNQAKIKNFINRNLNQIDDYLALTGQVLPIDNMDQIAFERLSLRLKQQLQPSLFERKATTESKNKLFSELETLTKNEKLSYKKKLEFLGKSLADREHLLTNVDKERKPIFPYTGTSFYKEAIKSNLAAIDYYLSGNYGVQAKTQVKDNLKNTIRMEGLYKRGLLGGYCQETKAHSLTYANNLNYKIIPPTPGRQPFTHEFLQTGIHDFQVETANRRFRWFVPKKELRRPQIFADLLAQFPINEESAEFRRKIILFGFLKSKNDKKFNIHMAKRIAEWQQYESNSVESVAEALKQSIVDSLKLHLDAIDQDKNLETRNETQTARALKMFEQKIQPLISEMLRQVNQQRIVETKAYHDILAKLSELKLRKPIVKETVEEKVKRHLSGYFSPVAIASNGSVPTAITHEEVINEEVINVETSDDSTSTDGDLETPTFTDISRPSLDSSNNSFRLYRASQKFLSTISVNNSTDVPSSEIKEQVIFDTTPYIQAMVEFQKEHCNKGAFLGFISNTPYLQAQIYMDLFKHKVDSKLSAMVVLYIALTSTQNADFGKTLSKAAENLLELTADSLAKNAIAAQLKQAIEAEVKYIEEAHPMTKMTEEVINPIASSAKKLRGIETADYNYPMNYLKKIAGEVKQQKALLQERFNTGFKPLEENLELAAWLNLSQKRDDSIQQQVPTLQSLQ
jgi:predicted small metal-binding protein